MAGSQAGGGAAPGGEYSGGRAGTRPQRGRGGGGEGRAGGAGSEAIVAAGGNMVPHVRLM